MKSMITNAPSHRALITSLSPRVSLTFNAQVHDVISADGAVVDFNVPGPHGYGGPFFDFEALFFAAGHFGGAVGGVHGFGHCESFVFF